MSALSAHRLAYLLFLKVSWYTTPPPPTPTTNPLHLNTHTLQQQLELRRQAVYGFETRGMDGRGVEAVRPMSSNFNYPASDGHSANPRRPYRYIDPSSWSSRPASAPVIKSCPIQFQNTLLDALIKFQLEMCQMFGKFCYRISFVIFRLNFKQWVQNVYNYWAILHSDILFVFYSYNTRYHSYRTTLLDFHRKIPFC